jgi:hypothetical protein
MVNIYKGERRRNIYTQVKIPPRSPSLERGKTRFLVPSPFLKGELGWGKNNAKTSISQILQTCVYTVAF